MGEYEMPTRSPAHHYSLHLYPFLNTTTSASFFRQGDVVS
jgi:hypothetical protein